MADTEKKSINLENLKFDKQNPRLPVRLQGIDDESKVIDYMVKYGNIVELMLSIAETGYSDSEPLLVVGFALGQCTCSYDRWRDKQSSISRDTWSTRIEPLAPFWRYMYVPFFCHDASGKLENPTEIHVCIVDRQRILKIFDLHNELFDEMNPLNIKSVIEGIW